MRNNILHFFINEPAYIWCNKYCATWPFGTHDDCTTMKVRKPKMSRYCNYVFFVFVTFRIRMFVCAHIWCRYKNQKLRLRDSIGRTYIIYVYINYNWGGILFVWVWMIFVSTNINRYKICRYVSYRLYFRVASCWIGIDIVNNFLEDRDIIF